MWTMAMGVGLCGSVRGAEFCATDAQTLQVALIEAASNNQPDMIRIRAGLYEDPDQIEPLFYLSDQPFSLLLDGAGTAQAIPV